MRVLTVNAGSTSFKLERYASTPPLPDVAAPLAPLAESATASVPEADAFATYLRDGIDVVAHRFVRLPDDAPAVVRLAPALEARVARAGSDAPLHDASALRGVAIVARLAPELPQFAVSDSAFHRTMSPAATTYALPSELTRAGLRRLGFHGLSHEYAAHRGCALAGLDVRRARVVTAHLGGGSSLCAIDAGASIDTTMGYTPLEGLPMATRSGSVDPGLILHLLRGGMAAEALEEMLERRSGLLGISGISGDVRELVARQSEPAARLALDVLGWRLRSSLGSMVADLGGVDLIAFTGGIGEHAPAVRTAALAGGLGIGAVLDENRNTAGIEGCIHGAGSRVAVAIVTAREGWQLLRAVVAESGGSPCV